MRGGGTRCQSCIKRCSSLDLCTTRRYTYHYVRFKELVPPRYFSNKISKHRLGHLIIGNNSLAHGSGCNKCFGSTPKHSFCIFTNSYYFIVVSANCNNRGFVCNKTLSGNPDKGVSCT